MKKLKQSKIKMFVSVVIILAIVFCGNWLYKGRRVHFADNMMRQVICLELGKDKDSKDVTYRDLETIEELEIGPVGTFETIEDAAKCKNLKKLWVNSSVPQGEVGFELYKITETEERYYPPVSTEKMERIQKDLEKILKSARKIEEFSYSNVNDTFNISDIEFLKYGKNIKRIHIAYANITDFSVLKNCRSLRDVDLRYSAIDRADDLLKLKYVNRLILMDTPLAQNEEEISRLQKAFPEAKIVGN